MTEESAGRDRIQRILVAVDASPTSMAALQAAVDLARRIQAEVVGIFIEDIDLLRLGEFSFAQEIGLYTARPRRISRRHIQLQLRAQSMRVHFMLESLAEQARVRWTYRTVRGSTTTDLKEAAADADLIVLGRTGWSHRRRLGSTVQFILSHHTTRTLIIGDRPGSPSRILVVYDGSEDSKRALQSATDLIQDPQGFLIVGILAETSNQAKRLQREAFQWLNRRGIEPHFRWILGGRIDKLTSLVHADDFLLILPRSIEPLHGRPVSELLDELDCPVLLVG